MRAFLVPFGYPAYPYEDVCEHIEQSKNFLTQMGIEFIAANNIINFEDCAQAKKIASENDFDYIIVLIATWVEATNVIDVLSKIKNKPVLLWTHGNVNVPHSREKISFGSIASAGVLRETFEEFEYKFKFVVGNPYDIKLEKEITTFHKAINAIKNLEGARVGLVGYASMGMYTGLVDHIKVKKYFGAEIFHIDQFSVLNNLESVSKTMMDEKKKELLNEWSVSTDIEEELLDKTAALYIRFKELAKKNQLGALTVKCQYEMSLEYGFSPCVALSMLGSEMPICCEGDMLLLLSQMILSAVSNKVTTYGDVLEFLNNGMICAACGYAPKCFMNKEKPDINKHTAIISGLLITSKFKEEKVTVIRLANYKDGFKMHLITGHTEELNNFHEIGCPPYAGTIIKFDNKSTEDFMQEIMSQHYAIVFGDYEKEIREYCKIMNIKII